MFVIGIRQLCREQRRPCEVWLAAHGSLLECVAVDEVTATVGASDPGPTTTACGGTTTRGRAGAATIPSPRPGVRSPRRVRPGPRHRMGTGTPPGWGAPVALVVVIAVVMMTLEPVW